MTVTTQHPDYIAHLPEWQTMEQAMGGTLAVKGDDANLPKPAGMREAERVAALPQEEGSGRPRGAGAAHLFEGYKARAQYPLWVRDGVRAMVGLVARQVPVIALPPALEHMEHTATADGFSLRQAFVRVVRELLVYGRLALVVDVDEDSKPFIALYSAMSAINWRNSKNANGRDDLSLAVFAESRRKEDADEFSHESETVYRVLDLHESALRSRLLNEEGHVVEAHKPSSSRANRPIDFLPLVFCGATDNSPPVDEVPLLTMAQAALVEYQLSADYFSALHQTSHPQPWVSGLDSDVELSVTGPSAAWDLGQNGSCGYLEFTGSGVAAVRQAMLDQKSAALEAGARVMDIGTSESGEARKTRQADQHATLHSIVITAAEAIEQCLRYAAEWIGIKDTTDIRFSVTPEFAKRIVDAAVVAALQRDVIAGGVSWATYWDYLTTGKIAEHDYEAELKLLEQQPPPLGAIGEGAVDGQA